MSRSFKKFGVIKDKGLTSSDYNRKFRRINKQRIKELKDPKQLNEVVNQYDICDFKFMWLSSIQFDSHYYRSMSNSEIINLKRKYFNK